MARVTNTLKIVAGAFSIYRVTVFIDGKFSYNDEEVYDGY